MFKHGIYTIFSPAYAKAIRDSRIKVIEIDDFPPGVPVEDEDGRRAYFAVVMTPEVEDLFEKVDEGYFHDVS